MENNNDDWEDIPVDTPPVDSQEDDWEEIPVEEPAPSIGSGTYTEQLIKNAPQFGELPDNLSTEERDRRKTGNFATGALTSAIPWLDELFGLGTGVLGNKPFKEGYREGRDKIRKTEDAAMLDPVGGYNEGQAAALLGGGAAGIGARFIPGKVGQVTQAVTNPGSLVTKSPLTGGAISGLAGASNYGLGASREEDVEGLLQDFAFAGVTGGITGGVMGGTAAGLDKLSKIKPGGYGQAARKGLATLLGTDEVALERYAQRPQEVKGADRRSIYDQVDEQIARIKGEYDEAGKNRDLARQQRRKEISNTQIPEEATVRVEEALDTLRQMNTNESIKSYSALIVADQNIPLSRIKAALTKRLNSFKINGRFPEGPLRQRGLDELIAIRKELDNFDKAIPAQDLKTIYRILGDKSDDAWAKFKATGEKPSEPERAMIRLQGDINRELRKIDGYKEIMDALSKNTKLSTKANTLFANNPRVGLERATNPEKYPQYERTLQELSKATGINPEELIAEYRRAQQLKNNPVQMQQELMALPEEGRYVETLREYDKIKGSSAQSLLNQGANDRNLAAQDKISYLEQSIPGLRNSLEDLKAQDALNRDNTGGKGMRMSAIGAGAGAYFGGEPGAMVGFAAGAGLDKKSGFVAKTMVDVGKSVANTPGISHFGKLVGYLPPKFAGPISHMLKGSSKYLGTYHYIMWKRDEEYRRAFEEASKQSEKFSDEQLAPDTSPMP
jgi:cell fate (sporulation/competence/biofilm development) regulator YmcA (YheA/YmcA/DUF963 family)